ncbi:MAG: hypothetical protein ACYDD5_00210 [Sulfuricurvum sp.]
MKTKIILGKCMELTRYHYHWTLVEETEAHIKLISKVSGVIISGEKFEEDSKKYMTIEEDGRK